MVPTASITQGQLDQLAIRTQGTHLPLISGALLALLLIYCGRNYVLFGFDVPPWLLITALTLVVTTAIITVLATSDRIPAQFFQATGMLLVLFNGITTHINIIADLTAGIYTSALTVLALSLSVLSLRYFFVTLAIFITSWLASVMIAQDYGDWSSTFILILVASMVSFTIQKQRLNALSQVLELENKVDELESYLSLCANCRNAKDQEGNWLTLEDYLSKNEGKVISHGICPACKEELYGDILNETGKST